MTRRFIASAGVLGIVTAFALLEPVGVTAQAPATAARTSAPARAWTAPRTAEGQPDLQGFWTNTTYTPLERPDGVTKEFYTREEAIAQASKAAAAEAEQTEPGTILDVHYDFTQFGLDRSQGGGALNLRTSMIVDPPDGKLPPMTAEGKQRGAARAEARKRMGPLTDAVQNFPLDDRCILMDRAGPPMMPGAYNNNYQIVQTASHVMILVEMIHDARVIPLDRRPHLPSNVRQLMGSNRAHWEGNTLVVESSNFTDKTAFRGASENMRLTERFTRIDEDTIRYQFTVDDPSTWTRPWSAEMPMRKTVGPLFEHACHEGNYPLYNTLAGARAEEQKKAAESAAKTSN
jgi:cell division septation protein DedD